MNGAFEGALKAAVLRLQSLRKLYPRLRGGKLPYSKLIKQEKIDQ